MHCSGYAFTEGSEEKQAKIAKRYNEIRHAKHDLNLVIRPATHTTTLRVR